MCCDFPLVQTFSLKQKSSSEHPPNTGSTEFTYVEKTLPIDKCNYGVQRLLIDRDKSRQVLTGTQ